jgi:hypothetical protein
MVTAFVVWVLLAPLFAATLVRRNATVTRFVALHYGIALTAGLVGGLMLFVGTVLSSGPAGKALLAGGAPLLGFAYWKPSDGGDGPGGGGGPGGEDEPPPDGGGDDRVDWERFMRELKEWEEQRALVH